MQRPISSQLPEQGPSPRSTPSLEHIALHQITPEGNSDPIPTSINHPSEPAESLQPSVSERPPNPGEAAPLVEKHGKAETGGRRSRFSVVTIFSDIVAVVVPLAFLTFMVVVWNLDAKQIEGDSFAQWQSAITVVRFE